MSVIRISDRELLDARIWLHPGEAARVLRVSKRSVYRLGERGVITATEDRPRRYSTKSIRKYMESQAGEL